MIPHKWHQPSRRKFPDLVRGFLDVIPLGLHPYQLQVTGELIFRGANFAADRILEIDHRALIGKSIEVVFPNLAHSEIPAAYRQITSNGG